MPQICCSVDEHTYNLLGKLADEEHTSRPKIMVNFVEKAIREQGEIMRLNEQLGQALLLANQAQNEILPALKLLTPGKERKKHWWNRK